MDIVARDELNNPVFTVIADRVVNSNKTPRGSWFNSPPRFMAIEPNNGTVGFKYFYNGKQGNETADVYYSDVFSNGRVFTNFTLRPQPCHPGFVHLGDRCVCENKTGILG